MISGSPVRRGSLGQDRPETRNLGPFGRGSAGSSPVAAAVLVAQQSTPLQLPAHRREKSYRDLPRNQPVSILAEHRRIPHLIVDRQPNEPPEQQAVVQLFHQQPFTALSVQSLQQQRPQQLFRRNRRLPRVRIQTIEVLRQFA